MEISTTNSAQRSSTASLILQLVMTLQKGNKTSNRSELPIEGHFTNCVDCRQSTITALCYRFLSSHMVLIFTDNLNHSKYKSILNESTM